VGEGYIIITLKRQNAGRGKCVKGRTAKESILDADTHIDILGQQLIRRLVLLQRVVIDTTACERAAEEKAKESVTSQARQHEVLLGAII